MDTLENLRDHLKDRHHAIGGFLKFTEAALIALQCSTFLNNRKACKALENIIKAIQKARPVFDLMHSSSEATFSRRNEAVRPGGTAYYGDELDALHKLKYVIETKRQIRQDDVRLQGQLYGQGYMREMREHYGPNALSFKLPDELKQELNAALADVLIAARNQPPLFPGVPVARPSLGERHAAMRTAMIANPDQPQATFVKLYGMHPASVRLTRRELEEAGTIPFLPHRHGPALGSRKPRRNANDGDDIRGLADKTRRAKSPIETTTTAHLAEAPATVRVRLSGEDEPGGDGAPIPVLEMARANHWDHSNTVSERLAATHNRSARAIESRSPTSSTMRLIKKRTEAHSGIIQ